MEKVTSHGSEMDNNNNSSSMAVATTTSSASPKHSTTPNNNHNVIYSDDPKSVYLPKIKLKSRAAERTMVERLCGYVPAMPTTLPGASTAATTTTTTTTTMTTTTATTLGGGLIIPNAIYKWVAVLQRQRELAGGGGGGKTEAEETSSTSSSNTTARDSAATTTTDVQHPTTTITATTTTTKPPTIQQQPTLTEETIAELKVAIEDYERFIYPPYYETLRGGCSTSKSQPPASKATAAGSGGALVVSSSSRQRPSVVGIAEDMAELQRRKLPPLPPDSVDELVSRLYTQDLTHRRQMAEKLYQQQYVTVGGGGKGGSSSATTPPSRTISADEVAESANRLASSDLEQRRENLQVLVKKYYGGETSGPTLGPSQLEEFTTRIYYDYLARVKQNKAELFEKYGFHRKPGRFAKLTPEQQKASADRLASARPKRGAEG